MYLENTPISDGAYTDKELDCFIFGQFIEEVRYYYEGDKLLFAFESEQDLKHFRKYGKQFLAPPKRKKAPAPKKAMRNARAADFEDLVNEVLEMEERDRKPQKYGDPDRDDGWR